MPPKLQTMIDSIVTYLLERTTIDSIVKILLLRIVQHVAVSPVLYPCI